MSLIEVLITLVISSIILGSISIGLPAIKSSIERMIAKSTFKEQYLIFLIKFEEHFQLTAVENKPSGIYLDNLKFLIDLNWNGSYEPSDRITYRWNKSRSRLEMAKGNGRPNSILEGVSMFSWVRTGISPLCYQMSLKNLYDKHSREIEFCKQSK